MLGEPFSIQLYWWKLSPQAPRLNDRGAKFRYYRRLSSVREYLILEQDRPAASLYRRQGDGDIFSRYEFEGMDAELVLTSIDLRVPLKKLYRRVQFPEVNDPA